MAEVQDPQRLEQTDRNLLLQHLQPGRHGEIQNFLGAAPSFNVVFFSKVYDCRKFEYHLAFTCSGNTMFTGAWSTRWLSSFKTPRYVDTKIRQRKDTRCIGALPGKI